METPGTSSKGWERKAVLLPAGCSHGHACLTKTRTGASHKGFPAVCPQAGLCALCEVHCFWPPHACSLHGCLPLEATLLQQRSHTAGPVIQGVGSKLKVNQRRTVRTVRASRNVPYSLNKSGLSL